MNISEEQIIDGGKRWSNASCRWLSCGSEWVLLPVSPDQVEKCAVCKHYSPKGYLQNPHYACMKRYLIIYPNSCCEDFKEKE